MAGWNPELVNRAMELLENIAGVYRESKSPLRHLWRGPGVHGHRQAVPTTAKEKRTLR